MFRLIASFESFGGDAIEPCEVLVENDAYASRYPDDPGDVD